MGLSEEFLEEYNLKVLSHIKLPSMIKGKYEVESCLKSGEGREVFLLRAVDGRGFILKAQPTGQDDSLKNEFEMLRLLSYSNLPQAVDYFSEDGVEYFLRTYVEGINLYDHILQNEPYDEGKSIAVILSLCEILQYLHAQNPPIIHRDIKPQNIILTPDGSCKLIDLGTARRFKENEQCDTIFMGTQVTAPPEQFGYRQTDARSDIYGLGMLLRFLLTGSFDMRSDLKSSLSMKKVIGKCTAFDPKNRFRSVKSLARALRLAQRKRVVRASAVALAGLLVLAVIFLCWTNGQGIRFKNALLEEAVRQELGLTASESIPRERLSEVTGIIICRKDILTEWSLHNDSHRSTKYNGVPDVHGDISDISELALLPNLQSLVLDYQQIEDISVLANLPLTQLSLCGNHISDISPLAKCTGLTALSIEENPIENAEALRSLISLRELRIGDTRVADATCFSGLPLETLLIRAQPLADYEPLTQLKWLKRIEVELDTKEQLDVITSLTSLEDLNMKSAAPVRMEQLAQLVNLQYLDLSGSNISDVSGAEQLSHLTYLNLSHLSLIESLEPLTKMPMLVRAQFQYSQIADFTPLLRCKNLQEVQFSDTQREQVEQQLPEAPFQILYWDNHT